MQRLPHILRCEILTYYVANYGLNWRFAKFRNIEQTLLMACQFNRTDIVEQIILKNLDETIYTNALIKASEMGYPKCVELLIPVSNPTADNSQALRVADYNGHSECTTLLFPVSDTDAISCLALRGAAICDNRDCVKLITSVSDPSAENSNASQVASVYGHSRHNYIKCLELLV